MNGSCFVAVLHGTYDATSNEIMGLAVAGLSAFVFCGYLHAGERINAALADGLVATPAQANARGSAPAPLNEEF